MFYIKPFWKYSCILHMGIIMTLLYVFSEERVGGLQRANACSQRAADIKRDFCGIWELRTLLKKYSQHLQWNITWQWEEKKWSDSSGGIIHLKSLRSWRIPKVCRVFSSKTNSCWLILIILKVKAHKVHHWFYGSI